MKWYGPVWLDDAIWLYGRNVLLNVSGDLSLTPSDLLYIRISKVASSFIFYLISIWQNTMGVCHGKVQVRQYLLFGLPTLEQHSIVQRVTSQHLGHRGGTIHRHTTRGQAQPRDGWAQIGTNRIHAFLMAGLWFVINQRPVSIMSNHVKSSAIGIVDIVFFSWSSTMRFMRWPIPMSNPSQQHPTVVTLKKGQVTSDSRFMPKDSVWSFRPALWIRNTCRIEQQLLSVG